jgi:hypothetical protein
LPDPIIGVDALPNVNNFVLFKQNIDRSPCHVFVNAHNISLQILFVVDEGIGRMKRPISQGQWDYTSSPLFLVVTLRER